MRGARLGAFRSDPIRAPTLPSGVRPEARRPAVGGPRVSAFETVLEAALAPADVDHADAVLSAATSPLLAPAFVTAIGASVAEPASLGAPLAPFCAESAVCFGGDGTGFGGDATGFGGDGVGAGGDGAGAGGDAVGGDALGGDAGGGAAVAGTGFAILVAAAAARCASKSCRRSG